MKMVSRNYCSTMSALCLAVTLGACAGGPSLDDIQAGASTVLGDGKSAGALSSSDITLGLKEALTKATSEVVAQLGAAKGFSGDPAIRIPLPKSLLKAKDVAAKFGQEKYFVDLESKLNEAAEDATPRAKDLFVGAIKDMSVEDASGILKGPDNAATEYFRGKTGSSLEQAMRPLIDNALSEVGAVQSFNSLLSRYKRIPGAPAVEADLTGHVVDKGSDGIFYYIAEEEKAIRTNPLERTSDILRRVFGGS